MDVSQVVVGKTDVSEMIRTSNARDFGLSEMQEYFEQVLRISEIEELVDREKKIDLLKWNWICLLYTSGSLCSSFLPDRLVSLPVKRPYAITL